MVFGLFRKPRRAIEGTGDYRQEIVGESNYQKALDRITGGKTEYGHELEITAEIILDDGNPYDDKAVRIDIDGRTVGYLTRKDARKYRKWLDKQGAPSGVVVECAALIRGGWDRGKDDKGHYGVRLDLPPL